MFFHDTYLNDSPCNPPLSEIDPPQNQILKMTPPAKWRPPLTGNK